MYHVAAGKVERADNVADKGALAAPNHVGKRRIDHEQPNAQEGRHGTKLNAAGQAARDDGGSDHGKRHLEGDVDDLRVDGTIRRRRPATSRQQSTAHQPGQWHQST